MATPINTPLNGDIWHLSIDDLLAPLPETSRLGGAGPFVINLSVSTAPISVPTKPIASREHAQMYQIQRSEDGRTRYRLRLGPFADEDIANAILATVREIYPSALTATAADDDLRAIAAMQAKAEALQTPVDRPTAKQAPVDRPAEKVSAAMPREKTPPPREVTSPPREVTSPPREVTSPAREMTPPNSVPTAAAAPESRAVSPPNLLRAAAPTSVAVAPSAAAPTAILPASPPPAQIPPTLASPVRLSPTHAVSTPVPRTPVSRETPATPPEPRAAKPVPAAPPAMPPASAPPSRVLPARAPPVRLSPPQAVSMPIPQQVERLSEPLANLESTQTVRLLTSIELEDDEALRWYVIQLSLSEQAFDPDTVPNLDIFSVYRLYSVAAIDQGHIMHALRLGFFGEEVAAAAVASYLEAYYDKPTVKRVSVAERERFADQTVEARKDVGATGRHAVIEITDELVVRKNRISSSTLMAETANQIFGHRTASRDTR
jgi:hypothetical protein